MARSRVSIIFMPPAAGEPKSPGRVADLGTVRALWVGVALALDVALYALLRHAAGLRPDMVRRFAEINCSLMALDLALTLVWLRRPWRGHRAVLTACILMEALAATVWIQLTGTISSYFLIVGFLLILLYRLLFDYASGLTCALGMMIFHGGAFVLEAAGGLRPAALFVAAPLGIYDVPLFREAAMLSLLVGYGITFVAVNFLATTLHNKDVALKKTQLDLARAVDETKHHGRLCGQVVASRYELIELIGRGGMGEVYHAQTLTDEQHVAVKILHAHLIDQLEVRERFRREALMVSRVPGPHVPKVIECGVTTDGQEYIVMEYLRGEDLGAVLRRRGQLPLDEVLLLVDKIATSLAAAHAVGVVHRDLKPQNVFVLDGSGEVRLLDFGIARLQESEGMTLTCELLGTAGYLAPEQARGGAEDIGPHTDVFALGAIVYRALTGKCAFPSRSTAAAVYESLHLSPTPPSRLVAVVPEAVDDVLALALAKRADERYALPMLFACDLRLAARGALGPDVRDRARRLSPGEDSQTRRIIHPSLQ
jgi:tRNA A-37 threonylcarbamoyl transferase component Bud32